MDRNRKLERVELTDHEFAKWLKDHGWTGQHRKLANSVQYMVKGDCIAMASYDNKNSVRINTYLMK